MGFGTMIVGFFFVFFNFNFGPVNLFPDLVGYILLCIGGNQLAGRIDNKHFYVLGKTAKLLIALSVLDLFVKNSSILNGAINGPDTIEGRLFIGITTLLTVFLSVFFFYNLSTGISEEAGKGGNSELAERAAKTNKLFMVYQLAGAIILLGTLIFVGEVVQYQIGGSGFFLMIGLIIVILYLFVQVRKMLKLASETFEDNQQESW
ncbi:hypothetical protein DRW41_11235 [Neobacillus piezotolerans]|uniref:Uncharacterized protein n=1 Tax=Neobacillus piezotolerans TaxID=2259171 RepID=A0A3D8GQM5_9BACI|nr:hypothetical protein [Neobacillus piezotolerans]RDU36627.1 hypothetical protein DRW41_11235 [Neobacillus piezotolerans]